MPSLWQKRPSAVHDHVDVGIAAAWCAAGADRDEGAWRVAPVDQMMAVGDALGPGQRRRRPAARVRPSSSTSTASPASMTTNSSSPSCQWRWLDHAPGSSVTWLAPEFGKPGGGASRRYQRPCNFLWTVGYRACGIARSAWHGVDCPTDAGATTTIDSVGIRPFALLGRRMRWSLIQIDPVELADAR